MAQHTHVVGIDPGIVHTGVVSAEFLPNLREVRTYHEVVQGTDASAVARIVKQMAVTDGYIEGYRSRSNLNHDQQMQVAVSEMRKATGFRVLDNTGIKTTVKVPVLQLLGIWKFSTPTHHQDLRSAARILVLGMLKEHNELLADVVRDHLDGRPWRVQ